MSILKAKKENKSYKINEAQKAGYLAQGFDIYEDGVLVERSPLTNVPYAEYKKLEDKVAALEAKATLEDDKVEEKKSSKGKSKPKSEDEVGMVEPDDGK